MSADPLQSAAIEVESEGKQRKGCKTRLREGALQNYHPLTAMAKLSSACLKNPIDTAAPGERSVYPTARLPRDRAADNNPFKGGQPVTRRDIVEVWSQIYGALKTDVENRKAEM